MKHLQPEPRAEMAKILVLCAVWTETRYLFQEKQTKMFLKAGKLTVSCMGRTGLILKPVCVDTAVELVRGAAVNKLVCEMDKPHLASSV